MLRLLREALAVLTVFVSGAGEALARGDGDKK
jgi:hypothetical protein